MMVVLLVLPGCAGLQTIDRTTTIPTGHVKTDETGDGVAIHLDAQQRLVLATARGYCAEPSPDAMAAYAASLGVGITTEDRTAALTQALQNSTASIGLRTQSITLMRDALYRICEASANGSLSDWEVATLLHRSQDLTAVVLAIEQLTGAVVANQAILASSTYARASANLLNNQRYLNQANEAVRVAREQVDDAHQARLEAKVVVYSAADGVRSVVRNIDNNKNKDKITSDEAKSAVENAIDQTKTAINEIGQAFKEDRTVKEAEEVVKAVREMDAAVNGAAFEVTNASEYEQDIKKLKVESRKLLTAAEIWNSEVKRWEDATKTLEETTEVRDAFRRSRDDLMTSVTSGSGGSGQFSPAIQASSLSDEATKAIAKAVSDMVGKALDKDYSVEACLIFMAELAENRETPRDQAVNNLQRCTYLVRNFTAPKKMLSVEWWQEHAGSDSDAVFTGPPWRIFAEDSQR